MDHNLDDRFCLVMQIEYETASKKEQSRLSRSTSAKLPLAGETFSLR